MVDRRVELNFGGGNGFWGVRAIPHVDTIRGHTVNGDRYGTVLWWEFFLILVSLYVSDLYTVKTDAWC